jgi:hypothetical protein
LRSIALGERRRMETRGRPYDKELVKGFVGLFNVPQCAGPAPLCSISDFTVSLVRALPGVVHDSVGLKTNT